MEAGEAPLRGRSIVITRGAEAAAPLREALEGLGASVRVVATTVQMPAAGGDLAAVVSRRGTYSHLVFTSQAAVRFFFAAAATLGARLEAWRDVRIAAVGPATAEALRQAGLEPALSVRSGGGKALAHALIEKEGLAPGHRVLLPQSAIARPELREELEAAGVAVDAVTVYDTVPAGPQAVAPLVAWLDAGQRPDGVVFASPSALRAFLDFLGERGPEVFANPSVRIVTIGATTSRAVREAGFEVAAEAEEPTTGGMVAAMLRAVRGG